MNGVEGEEKCGGGGGHDGEAPAVSLEALRKRMADFARERDWDQFHSPRNLLLALVCLLHLLSFILPRGLADWFEGGGFLSSLGGFSGATTAAKIFFRKRTRIRMGSEKPKEWLRGKKPCRPVPFSSLLVLLHCHVNGGCPRFVEIHNVVRLQSWGTRQQQRVRIKVLVMVPTNFAVA
jgi:hypothetical protein